MKSARPSAASLPQLAVTRKPRPNDSARACAITAMPPLWLTIDTAPASERRPVLENGGERSGEAVGGVEDADAIRAAEQEAALAAERRKRRLQRHAVAADLGEAAGPRNARGHAGVDALAHDVEDALRGHGDDREIGHAGKLAQGGIARQAGDRRAARIDGPHRAREAEAREVTRRDAAEVALAVGGADDRDGARRQAAASARRRTSCAHSL